jgi:hypothetical protein
MNLMIDVIYTFVLAHLIVKFEPIHWILDATKPSGDHKLSPVKHFIWHIIEMVLSCFKCSSLWIGFILGGFWCGVFTSFFAYIYQQSIAPFIDGIRFK